MIKILLMFPWAVLGNLIAQDLGFGKTAQITCGFIGCFLASILIDML